MTFLKKKLLDKRAILQFSLIFLTFVMLSQFEVYRLNQVNSTPTTIMDTPLLGRYGHSIVYNPDKQKIIMFGGFNYDENSDLDDMWEYDCTTDTWRELYQSTKPPATSSHGMVYDSINRKFVLFGGSGIYGWEDKTWVYDPSNNSWTEMLPQVSPSPRGSASMYFDPELGETVLYGGYSDLAEGADETWTYNYENNTWTFHDLATKPPARYGAGIVYDPVNQRGVLFGGRIIGQHTLNGTWEFNSSSMSWTKLNLTVSPSARYWYCMDYDPVNKVMILFGGSEGEIPFSQETWAFDVTSDQWSQMNPISNPLNRSFHK
ncbi:MAG: Kelch repeat-containing protein, partial [Candidatus Kariarchaeaceae archaeon]